MLSSWGTPTTTLNVPPTHHLLYSPTDVPPLVLYTRFYGRCNLLGTELHGQLFIACQNNGIQLLAKPFSSLCHQHDMVLLRPPIFSCTTCFYALFSDVPEFPQKGKWVAVSHELRAMNNYTSHQPELPVDKLQKYKIWARRLFSKLHGHGNLFASHASQDPACNPKVRGRCLRKKTAQGFLNMSKKLEMADSTKKKNLKQTIPKGSDHLTPQMENSFFQVHQMNLFFLSTIPRKKHDTLDSALFMDLFD